VCSGTDACECRCECGECGSSDCSSNCW
jgi:hypothetical protein